MSGDESIAGDKALVTWVMGDKHFPATAWRDEHIGPMHIGPMPFASIGPSGDVTHPGLCVVSATFFSDIDNVVITSRVRAKVVAEYVENLAKLDMRPF